MCVRVWFHPPIHKSLPPAIALRSLCKEQWRQISLCIQPFIVRPVTRLNIQITVKPGKPFYCFPGSTLICILSRETGRTLMWKMRDSLHLRKFLSEIERKDFWKDIHISVKVNDCRIKGVNNLLGCFGFGRLSAVNLEQVKKWSGWSCLSCGNYILAITYHYFQTTSRRDTTICMT